jgi:hypothetical protein
VRLIDWLTIGAAVGSVIVFALIVRTGHDERHAEDDARAYFDEHGHWPDETPDDVERRQREAAAQAQALATRSADPGVEVRMRRDTA